MIRGVGPRGGALGLVLLGVMMPSAAGAYPVEPAPRAADAFDFMNQLSRHGLHDLNHERWNLYGQLTWISSFKLPFHAPYTNLDGTPDSLLPGFEHSFTGTVTLFFGLRLWPGAELYWVPEVITGRPLSGLTGLGGVIQNFELQKQGSVVPTPYSSRLYLRQTIELGGPSRARTSEPLQLGGRTSDRRIVLTVGNFSVLDFFDKNSYAGDLRRQFFNMAFLTNSAYDFAADARGYTWGAVAELFLGDWAFRIGHLVAPTNPNQLELNFRFWQYFGDQVEVEHAHVIGGMPGAVRVLAFRNYENMGRFDEAIASHDADPARNATTCTGFSYGSQNMNAPDLCWSRRPNVKMGIGINLEQNVFRDVGVFARAMYSDGQSEVYSYTSADRSLSFGVLARGSLWRRPRDYAGVGFGAGWISSSHAAYLGRGGIDGFIGDGRIHASAESVFETFYGVNLSNSIWFSGDYQFISNPGFNADRGPVHIFGARLHAEF